MRGDYLSAYDSLVIGVSGGIKGAVPVVEQKPESYSCDHIVQVRIDFKSSLRYLMINITSRLSMSCLQLKGPVDEALSNTYLSMICRVRSFLMLFWSAVIS